MRVQPYPVLSIRKDGDNPNHHLWNNNGTWYIAYTVHTSAYTTERVRESLKTKDVREARWNRDLLLGEVGHA